MFLSDRLNVTCTREWPLNGACIRVAFANVLWPVEKGSPENLALSLGPFGDMAVTDASFWEGTPCLVVLK